MSGKVNDIARQHRGGYAVRLAVRQDLRKERFGFHAVGRAFAKQRPVVICVRQGFGIALVGQSHVAVRYVQNGKRLGQAFYGNRVRIGIVLCLHTPQEWLG